MTQKYPVPPNTVPLSDSVSPPASNSGNYARMAAAVCLLLATALAPISVYADEITPNSEPTINNELAIEDEDPESADDGSSALRDMFKSYDLKDVEPISAKEEAALLGNWGDSDAEDGD